MRAWGKVCALAVLMALPTMAQAADQRDERTRPDSGRGSEEEVVLGCTVQTDYRLADCKVLGSASDAAAKEAVSRTNGRTVSDRGAPGEHIQVTYIYRGQD